MRGCVVGGWALVPARHERDVSSRMPSAGMRLSLGTPGAHVEWRGRAQCPQAGEEWCRKLPDRRVGASFTAAGHRARACPRARTVTLFVVALLGTSAALVDGCAPPVRRTGEWSAERLGRASSAACRALLAVSSRTRARMHVDMNFEAATKYAVGMPREDDELDAAVEETLTASRALVGVVARSLAEVLEHVTLPQYRVLVVLCAAGALRSGELAERLGVHQSTLTRTGDRLVAQGLVRRDASPDSRREIMVSLTERGQAIVVQVLSQRRNDIREILGSVSEKDRKAILKGFHTFAMAAGERENEHLLTLGMS